MDRIDKIDLIRERLEVSYEKANQFLEENGGDVVQALIKLEEGDTKGKGDRGRQLVKKIKQIIKKGNTAQILVQRQGKTLVGVPVTAGLVGATFFPYLSLLAVISAMYKDYTLKIIKDKGTKADKLKDKLKFNQ